MTASFWSKSFEGSGSAGWPIRKPASNFGEIPFAERAEDFTQVPLS